MPRTWMKQLTNDAIMGPSRGTIRTKGEVKNMISGHRNRRRQVGSLLTDNLWVQAPLPGPISNSNDSRNTQKVRPRT